MASIAAVEVAIPKACQDIAEDGGSQGRRLALLAHGLPAGNGKGTQQIGVRAVEALAGNLVAELDGRQGDRQRGAAPASARSTNQVATIAGTTGGASA